MRLIGRPVAASPQDGLAAFRLFSPRAVAIVAPPKTLTKAPAMASAVMPTYQRANVAFTHGEGCRLTDRDGRRYLDFAAGIAVCALGHAHPRLVAAITAQASQLWHCSNLFEIPGQEVVAARLAELCFGELVFFGNSGAEANEA